MSPIPPPPSYVALHDNTGSLRPPPNRRKIPRYHSSHKKKSSCCYRCICCCYCFLFLFLLVVSLVSLYIYAFYKPQAPSYKVDNFAVQAFHFQPDFTLITVFSVSVKADNPNQNIEFIYGSGSSVVVSYTDSTLCTGSIPAFRQGAKNTTVINVLLKGKSPFGSGLHEALQESQRGGKIPLLVQVKVPVNVVLAGFQTTQFKAHVNCSLVVDNLSPVLLATTNPRAPSDPPRREGEIERETETES